MVRPLLQNCFAACQTVKHITIIWFSNSSPSYIPKRKNIFTQIFMSALFIIAKMWKYLKCPLFIITMEYCSDIKNEWNIDTHYNIDNLEDIMVSKRK